MQTRTTKSSIRWWPGVVLTLLAAAAIFWTRAQSDWPFQKRNLAVAQIVSIFVILMLLWWTFFSRAVARIRLTVTYGMIGALVLGALVFRLQGVTGDLVPIFEFRWTNRKSTSHEIPTNPVSVFPTGWAPKDFPQFRGPQRDGVLSKPILNTNWNQHPPQVIWRTKVGPAWSGFAVVDTICLTQEQRGENECVVARDLVTGKELWSHADPARYNNIVAGEGPRVTPTVVSNRVFTLGATGILNALDLKTGKLIWTRNVLGPNEKIPDWGVAGSPLHHDGIIVVHGGENGNHSLHAFEAEDGHPVWSGGIMNPGYASPSFAILADTPQILAFNDGAISGQDPKMGTTLWQRPWGNGNAVCASPVVVNDQQVVFSSGYGVGAELLEISQTNARLTATSLWKSIRMKAKFSHLFARDGFLYGLDDGIFACVNLKDGSQQWKEGRYGHGQGLLVGNYYLLMAESGDLVLLHPTPETPRELTRFPVFKSKTWNPIALAGDLLVVRNDREAACLLLPTVKE